MRIRITVLGLAIAVMAIPSLVSAGAKEIRVGLQVRPELNVGSLCRRVVFGVPGAHPLFEEWHLTLRSAVVHHVMEDRGME